MIVWCLLDFYVDCYRKDLPLDSDLPNKSTVLLNSANKPFVNSASSKPSAIPPPPKPPNRLGMKSHTYAHAMALLIVECLSCGTYAFVLGLRSKDRYLYRQCC